MPDEPSPDIARVRLVLQRELETISSYEQLAREATSEQTRAFFLHLAREEKEHVAEATQLLRALDRDQDAHFTAPTPAGHFEHGIPRESPTPPPAPDSAATGPDRTPEVAIERVPHHPARMLHALPAPPVSSGALTVGSLKRPLRRKTDA